jgi:hypothetical protein
MRQRRSRHWRPLTLAMACGFALGCSASPTRTADPEAPPPEFVLLSVAGAEGTAEVRGKVDVSAGAAYDTLRTQVKTVALLLPAECASDAGGDVAERCDRWSKALGVAAAAVGWKVGGTAASGAAAPVQVARDAGAQIVLSLGRIEESAPAPAVSPATPLATSFTFWAASVQGEPGAAKRLPDGDATALRAFAETRLAGEAGAAPIALQAAVDLTILNGETGLPVWFYQHVASTTAGGPRRNARFLFARYKGEWFPARRRVPLRSDGDAPPAGDAATAAARAALRAYVAKDIVDRFQSGKGGQP